MRISDWSSDVCSSDLRGRLRLLDRIAARLQGWRWAFSTLAIGFLFFVVSDVLRLPWTLFADWHISRAFHLSSQPLGDFLSQAALSSVVSGLFGAPFLFGKLGIASCRARGGQYVYLSVCAGSLI